MRIIDEALLRAVRRQPCCSCGRRPSHAAHILAKGFGGGGRLDIPENVVPLCARCHSASHTSGQPSTRDLLDYVARLNGVTADEIAEYLWQVRRSRTRPQPPWRRTTHPLHQPETLLPPPNPALRRRRMADDGGRWDADL